MNIYYYDLDVELSVALNSSGGESLFSQTGGGIFDSMFRRNSW